MTNPPRPDRPTPPAAGARANTPTRLADALEEALRQDAGALAEGPPSDDACLGDPTPDDAGIGELVDAAAAVRRLAEPAASWRARGRADLERRLAAEVERSPARRRPPWRLAPGGRDAGARGAGRARGREGRAGWGAWGRRLAGALAALALLVAAADRATAGSRPGDALWPLRAALDGGHRAAERLALAMRDAVRGGAQEGDGASRPTALPVVPGAPAERSVAPSVDALGAAGRDGPPAPGTDRTLAADRATDLARALRITASPPTSATETAPGAVGPSAPPALAPTGEPGIATRAPGDPLGPSAPATQGAPGGSAATPGWTPAAQPTDLSPPGSTQPPAPTSPGPTRSVPTAPPTAAATSSPTPAPTLRACTGAIRGRVTALRRGPAPGARVEAVALSVAGGSQRASAAADATGAYTVTALCDGSYAVEATWPTATGETWTGAHDPDGDGRADPIVLDAGDPGLRERTGIDVVVGPATPATAPPPTMPPGGPDTPTPVGATPSATPTPSGSSGPRGPTATATP